MKPKFGDIYTALSTVGFCSDLLLVVPLFNRKQNYEKGESDRKFYSGTVILFENGHRELSSWMNSLHFLYH